MPGGRFLLPMKTISGTTVWIRVHIIFDQAHLQTSRATLRRDPRESGEGAFGSEGGSGWRRFYGIPLEIGEVRWTAAQVQVTFLDGMSQGRTFAAFYADAINSMQSRMMLSWVFSSTLDFSHGWCEKVCKRSRTITSNGFKNGDSQGGGVLLAYVLLNLEVMLLTVLWFFSKFSQMLFFLFEKWLAFEI